MENQDKKVSSVRLVLDEKKFKLVVKKSLEDKIRYLCAMFPDNEYSGALFYKTSGNVGDDDFTVICEDFCLCDIGSSTYTEFETKPEVVTYMCDNDLLGCYIGLLHSHDKLETFFSGTDKATLKEEGESMPHFVSLIVNNKGEYTAAITSKVTRTFKGVVEETSTTFGNVSAGISSSPKEYSESCIKYNMLDIQVERDPWFNTISEKTAAIKESKKSSVKKSTGGSSVKEYYSSDTGMWTPLGNDSNQLYYPSAYTNDKDSDDEYYYNIFSSDEFCEDIIKEALFLGSKTGKQLDKESIESAAAYYRGQRKKGPKTTSTKLEKSTKAAIRSASGGYSLTSSSVMSICDDLVTYISLYQEDHKAEVSTIDALDDVVSVILSIIEK